MIFAVVMCYPDNNHVLTIKRDIAGMYVAFFCRVFGSEMHYWMRNGNICIFLMRYPVMKRDGNWTGSRIGELGKPLTHANNLESELASTYKHQSSLQYYLKSVLKIQLLPQEWPNWIQHTTGCYIQEAWYRISPKICECRHTIPTTSYKIWSWGLLLDGTQLFHACLSKNAFLCNCIHQREQMLLQLVVSHRRVGGRVLLCFDGRHGLI